MCYRPLWSREGANALAALTLAWAVLIVLLIEFARAMAFILS
jgi:hypothetical protein